VPAANEFTAAVGQAGLPPPLVARLQRGWPFAIVALAVLLGLLEFAYTDGIPPRRAGLRLRCRWRRTTRRQRSARVARWARTCAEPPARGTARRNCGAVCARERADGAGNRHRLEFRRTTKGDGINAFALPGGTIVLLDGLVDRTNSAQLLGVLGHELGHVKHKHGMRNVLQATGFSALAALLWGDFAGVTTNVPVAIGELNYSRDFEREADDHAIAYLRANGLSTQPLLDFFNMVADLGHERSNIIPDFFGASVDARAHRAAETGGAVRHASRRDRST
jgi:hypothetical protein